MTVLSAGFALLPLSARADFSAVKSESKYVRNKNLDQYKDLNEIKTDSDAAATIHEFIHMLPNDREEIRKNQKQIDRYNEIALRLKNNVDCNIDLMNDRFSDGKSVWDKISAYAEESAKEALAKASDDTADDAAQLNASSKYKTADSKQADADSDNLSEQYMKGNFGDVDALEDAPEGQSLSDKLASQKKEANKANSKMNATQTSETEDASQADKLRAFARIRWDIGTEVLKNLYAYPQKWGKMKTGREYMPWMDQKYTYDFYLQQKYIEGPLAKLPPLVGLKALKETIGEMLFASKQLKDYLPEVHYREPDTEDAEDTAGELPSDAADEFWCGKDNKCLRVNKGPIFEKHEAIITALASAGVDTSKIKAPYVPAAPLPPWQEATFMLDEELTKGVVQDPWLKIEENDDLLHEDGEFANLVVKNKKVLFKSRCGSADVKVCIDPSKYDEEKGEPKKDKKGNALLPLPLQFNRVSSYLALASAEEEARPQKENAVESIKKINEDLIAKLKQVGYDVKNPQTFNLNDEAQYNTLVSDLRGLHAKYLRSSSAKIEAMERKYKNLFSSVKTMLTLEKTFAKSLGKDAEFLLSVDRRSKVEDYATFDSELRTAVADKAAAETYSANIESDDDDGIPPVGCPIL